MLLIAVIAGVPLVGGAEPVSACSCMMTTVEESLARGVVAFVGEAVSVRDIGYPEPEDGDDWWGPQRWTFRVESVAKGSLNELVEVGTGYGDADCGADFSQHGRVGIIAHAGPKGFETNICGGIWEADVLLAAAPDVSLPVPLPHPADSDPLWWAWGLGLAGSVGLFIVARGVSRRRDDGGHS